jgi:uncharacterized protein (TIGR02145 family)
MRSTDYWVSTISGEASNGTNESGFSALPGGYRNDKGDFIGLYSYGFWWSSTLFNWAIGNISWRFRLGYMDNGLSLEHEFKASGLSIRCVRDF